MSSLVSLTVLHALHAHAAIKLLSKNLVLLAEAVKFARQVMVLSGEAGSVLLKGLLLVRGISLVAAQLLVLAAGCLDVAAADKQFVLLRLQAKLGIADAI